MHKKIIARHDVEGQYPVFWFRQGEAHHIIYGNDRTQTHDDVHAAELFGYAVHHQIGCDGRFNS